MALIKHLPARGMSRMMGRVSQAELPQWMMVPVLRLYVKTFGCDMNEAEVEDVRQYHTFRQLFCRRLKSGSRTIHPEHPLVSSCDL